MNEIRLKGVINNIEYSHLIGNTEYYKADLSVPKHNGELDIFQLRFKKYSNSYINGDEVQLLGNLRSYSEKIDTKNKVHLYVFTYLDPVQEEFANANSFILDGRICKMDELRTSKSGNCNIHFILANNIISADKKQKLNAYIPMVAFGKVAREISKLNVSDKILVEGRLNSRHYTKLTDFGEEDHVAYEGIVNKFICK